MARGGARPGAGRKRLERYKYVPHRARAAHSRRHPMHITARAVRGLPSFRQQRIATLVLLQLRRLNDARFQIVHFSVQANHLHLIVEAEDREAIARKMSGLMISIAKRLNAMLGGRRGKVWSERYFRRDVTSARDMNNVLAYVFGNAKKHGHIPLHAIEIDYLSSAWTFDGWDTRVLLPPEPSRWKPPEPRTDLLKREWVAYGLLRVRGAPRSSAHARA
jgi:putative transposase